jgi:outer membrane protein OmpA-like peptidoglycan-associated protein
VRKTGILIFLVLIHCAVQAQNLVVNGSFEEKAYCPANFNQQQMKSVTGWSQLNEGTPDHFHRCSEKVGVPNNMFGKQEALDGDAYIGMAVYSPTQRNYREYLTSKLSRPLAAGELVCIEMYVSTADFSKYVTDDIGIVLSNERLKQERNQVVSMRCSLMNPMLNMLDAYNDWILISDVYQAQGGEEYITIGCFSIDKEIKIMLRSRDSGTKEDNKWSYIYVDNVSVKPVKAKSECSCENDIIKSMVVDPPLELSEYDKVKLDAIYFDFDKDELTDEAIKELDDVYSLLRKNKAMYLEIDGHADIIGNGEYNVNLSQRRAQRVIDYLVKKGIAADRLTIKAYGSTQPAADNETEEGRAQNRRVEFQVLEKRYQLIQ